MRDADRELLAYATMSAAALHTVTDIIEWAQGGFSAFQLWLNYAAFLAMPVVLIGLYAVQRPMIGRAALWGAVLYGCAFVYFAHTTLVALQAGTATYEELWNELGAMYTVHGAVMVAGGLAFGWGTLKAGVLPAWAALLFLSGLLLNLVLALLPLPDVMQTVGTLLRNAGLIGLGWGLLRTGSRGPQSQSTV